jgi:penicillin-binding protein A
MMKRFRPVLWTAASAAVLSVFATAHFLKPDGAAPPSRSLASLTKENLLTPRLERQELSEMLGHQRIGSQKLVSDFWPAEFKQKSYHVHFTLDRELQEKIEDVYQRYDPAYAAFVAMDPETGRILAMVDHSSAGHEDNLNLRSSFPAASVFKVVTSAAALAEGKVQPRSMFPVNGTFGTLYRKNLRTTVNRWTRFISIEEAFAKSVNTVFGKIAMNRVGPAVLQRYADQFAFNQQIPFDMPLELGSAVVPVDDEFGLAESGSGYTRKQTMSPIHGAMIAAAVVNGGRIPAPYMVDEVTLADGRQVFEAEENGSWLRPLDQETAKSLAVIMEHTVTRGTARREYRDYNHHPVLSKLFIGAKTGSLTGDSPQGKYDWFVGFAQLSSNPKKKIAFASMIVNRKYWRVKASHVAREGIIHHFKRELAKEI